MDITTDTAKIVSHFNVAAHGIDHRNLTVKKTVPYWHSHKNPHISFVYQNGKSETKRNSVYNGKKGSIFFYHSGQLHRWIAPKTVGKSINIEVEADFLKNYMFSEEGIKNAIQKNIDAKALLLKIQKETQLSDAHSASTIQTLFLELFDFPSADGTNDIPKWVDHLYQLLHDNWNKTIPLRELAATVGVHPVTISKYFRKYFSCTLGEYQRKLKTDRSIDLIKNSSMSLSEIAYACGFADQSHFTRNFKLQTHFLPKDFRRL